VAKMQLNAFANAISGKLGNAVFSDTESGTEVRTYVIPDNPDTPAQRKVRNNFTKYTAGWSALTSAQKAQWNTYAANIKRRDKTTGKLSTPQARHIYGGLTAKYYQINPTGTAPTTPPTAPFAGDSITVTVALVDGDLTFIASAANAAGVQTELLLQKLASDDRTPTKDDYRTQRFFAFTSGTLSTPMDGLAPGFYAPAYRFVKTATGQEVGIIELPVVQVP
jgi:hypothetical protein